MTTKRDQHVSKDSLIKTYHQDEGWDSGEQRAPKASHHAENTQQQDMNADNSWEKDFNESENMP